MFNLLQCIGRACVSDAHAAYSKFMESLSDAMYCRTYIPKPSFWSNGITYILGVTYIFGLIYKVNIQDFLQVIYALAMGTSLTRQRAQRLRSSSAWQGNLDPYADKVLGGPGKKTIFWRPKHIRFLVSDNALICWHHDQALRGQNLTNCDHNIHYTQAPGQAHRHPVWCHWRVCSADSRAVQVC